MKKMGRAHQPFFRICAVDKRAPRDGRVLEELGTYDPRVPETDARAILKPERIDYWLGVGAQPTEKVAVLIKKYGSKGTHAAQQAAARERLRSGAESVAPSISPSKMGLWGSGTGHPVRKPVVHRERTTYSTAEA